MKTERVFLMELFLDDELPKKIKLKIKDRFQELEDGPHYTAMKIDPTSLPAIQGLGAQLESAMMKQSPSMQRIMAQNPDLIKPPTPVTPAAAQALARRQELLNSAGKEEKGSTRPRKI